MLLELTGKQQTKLRPNFNYITSFVAAAAASLTLCELRGYDGPTWTVKEEKNMSDDD